MKKYIILIVMFGVASVALAQAPKWLEKAKRSVFSVVTYDKEDKLLGTGNGFFVSEDGIAMAEYSIFKDAYRAVVINAEGKQMPVKNILGANDMYDVVRFRVDITEKRVPALQLAVAGPEAEETVFLLPYSTQKDRTFSSGKVQEAASIGGGHFYYTLAIPLKDKMVGCPVVNADGQLFGLAQKAVGNDTTSICYAMGASYVMEQSISALSLSSTAIRTIGIKKALPDDADEALVFLFMSSTALSPEQYRELLNDFIEKFPTNADGYTRRANHILHEGYTTANLEQAEADLMRALSVAQAKDDAYFNLSKAIYAYQLTRPEELYKDWTYDRALQEIANALAIDSLPVYIQHEGDILFAMQRYAEAYENYKKVNNSNMASPETYYSAAKANELMEGDPNEMVVLLDSAIAFFREPFSQTAAPYLLERAQYKMAAEQYRSALQDYDSYLQAVNGEVGDFFYYLRSQAALHGRQYQRALDDIDLAIRMNPQEETYPIEKATINMRIGRFAEALVSLDAALVLNPENGDAYRMKGFCLIQTGDPEKGCENLRRAVVLGDEVAGSLLEKHCR